LEDRYFPNDAFQAIPVDGYTAMFERIFGHKNIRVALKEKFDKSMLSGFAHCFNSMPIDEFYDYQFGELPYRSIRFHMSRQPAGNSSPHVVVNYTDSGPYTRETWWHNIPLHRPISTGDVVCTVEEPCDYRENDMERYYPVKTHDGRFDMLYQKYKSTAERDCNLTFVGRCGTYQYLDMHQVINQSLAGARKWIAKVGK
jgi:UDP-galactopyranose mutase